MTDRRLDDIDIKKTSSNEEKEAFLMLFARHHPQVPLHHATRLKEASEKSGWKDTIISLVLLPGSLLVVLFPAQSIVKNGGISMGISSSLSNFFAWAALYLMSDAIIRYFQSRKLRSIRSDLDRALKTAGLSPRTRQNVLLAAVPTPSRRAGSLGGGSGSGGVAVGGGGCGGGGGG